jgi:tRNA-binding EMAP/Myf-like protein
MEINYEDFRKVDIRVGTVLSLRRNKKSHQPARFWKLILAKKLVLKQHQQKLPIIIIQII